VRKHKTGPFFSSLDDLLLEEDEEEEEEEDEEEEEEEEDDDEEEDKGFFSCLPLPLSMSIVVKKNLEGEGELKQTSKALQKNEAS
jgi:hypothetical protein